MANITVNTSTVKSKAEELKTLNSSFKKQVDTLVSTEGSLNSMWVGDAKEAFHNAFNKDITQMTNFYNAIEKFVSSLLEIVSSYEKAENTNLNTANTRKYK